MAAGALQWLSQEDFCFCLCFSLQLWLMDHCPHVPRGVTAWDTLGPGEGGPQSGKGRGCCLGDVCAAEAGGFLPLEMFLGSYGAAEAAVPLPPAVGCGEELALALGG